MPNAITVGTNPDCDVTLTVPSVSGRHCRLTREGNVVSIEDLGSRNGTYVNGARLDPSARIAIGPADTVHLGSHRLDLEPILPRLVVETTASPTLLTFPGEVLVIGRVAGNDLVIDLPTVSSRHARLTRTGANIFVEDLGSTNGTYIDGRRIQGPTMLEPSSILLLGSAPFRLSESSWRVGTAPVLDNRETPSASPIAPAVAVLAVGTLAAALAPLAFPAGSARMFAMAHAAVAVGGVDALAAAILKPRSGLGRGSSDWRVAGSVVALALMQGQFLGLVARWPGGVVIAAFPAIAILTLAALAGSAAVFAMFRLIPGPRGVRSATVVAMIVATGLLGGFAPAASDLPPAVRPILGVSPVRWAFEGLMVAGSSEDQVAPVERYFPAATDRMGLTADIVALAFMAVGLAGLAVIQREDETRSYPAFLTA